MPNLRLPKSNNNSSLKNVRNVIERLKKTVEVEQWQNLRDLISLIHKHLKSQKKLAIEATPIVHACLRIIKIAREEALKVLHGANADFEENSTNRLFASGDVSYEMVEKADLLDSILAALEEFSIDIQSCSENISDLSLDFVHSEELILTLGYSKIVYKFLRRAAENMRMFKVIVCEGYPDNLGHKLAEDLSNCGINVILVPDSHVFALMSRTNKVLIGCDAVYPDGTLRAPVGTHSVLLTAKHFSIPTYVCLPQYKLSPVPLKTCTNTPLFTVIPTADPSNICAEWLDSPATILPSVDAVSSHDLINRSPSYGPIAWSPRWEHVPSGLVSLYLTNLGSHAPSYLYALGRELFHPLDVQLMSSANY